MYYKYGTVYGSQQSIRNEMKNTSLPRFMSNEFILSLGYSLVVDQSIPEYDPLTHYLEDGEVEVIDGVPTKLWSVKEMPVYEVELDTEKESI